VNLIIEAASGTLSVTGDPEGTPMRPGLQTGDVLGAMYATYAVLSGLVGAARNGEGRIADVSLVETSIASAMLETGEFLATGKAPKAMEHRHRLAAPYQLFRTQDGRHLAIGSPSNKVFEAMMKVIGMETHLADARFATYATRKTNEDAIIAIVESGVAKRDARELEKELVDAGVPCALVRDFKDVFEDPQTVERGMLVDAPRPGGGRTRNVRNPILLDHDGPTIDRPPPMLGEHSREVLAEAGYAAAEIDKLMQDGVSLAA
jgi:crotonobetainyl-CoA:carnitine CoA-transferase CaiB-like acyl-CoA transferase